MTPPIGGAAARDRDGSMERFRESGLYRVAPAGAAAGLEARPPSAAGIATADYHQFFEQAPEACLITDEDGVILAANVRARKLLDEAATPGRRLLELITQRERSRLRTLLRSLDAGRAPRQWEFTTALASTRHRLEAAVSAGCHGGTLELRWILRDVTGPRVAEDRRREEEAVRGRARQLFAVSELVTELAHELNQPLAAIVNYARGCELRLRAHRLEPALLDAALEDIVAQAGRAGEVIRRLREGLDRRPAQPEALDLNLVVREVAALAGLDAGGERVTVRLEACRGLPRVCVDPLQMEQVLLKLIAALLRCGGPPAAGGPPAVVVRTRTPGGGRVEIEVELADDDGQPDGEEQTAFDRAQDAGASAHLDLELNLSRRLIESMGGDLRVHSGRARGGALSIMLPAL